MNDPAPTTTAPVGADAPTTPLGVGDSGGLRERKKKATRRALHEAALTLVAERGPENVTTDEIAAAAGVSARTFFNYFPTKDAAVIGLPPDVGDVLEAGLLARPDDEDLFTALTTVIRRWFAVVDADPLRDLRRTVVAQDAHLGAALVGANRDIEAALVRAATHRPDCPAGENGELRAAVTVAAVLGAARAAYTHHNGPAGGGRRTDRQGRSTDDTFVAAFDLLAEGLRIPRRS